MPTQAAGFISRRPNGDPSAQDYTIAELDYYSIHASEHNGILLYAAGMVTYLTIAISGVYPPDRPCSPSAIRLNRFMLLISEGDGWKDHYDELRRSVEDAKDQGLQDLEAHVSACNAEDEGSIRIQKSLKKRLRKLVGPVAPIHWYPYEFNYNTIILSSMAMFNDRSVIVERGPWRVPARR
ncbi:hypothetical protein PG997_009085 [Apiospora hydei]|uniref:Uncharacterized protein n=1 Tax=Apiospora hydei TaxID=1337664 RepID=A0ABR1VUC2_9PEZI